MAEVWQRYGRENWRGNWRGDAEGIAEGLEEKEDVRICK